MSQVPYIAIDTNIQLTINDEPTYSGSGQVVTPFNMIEITGYPKFSDFAENEHLFASLLPLFDGQYWLFYFKGNLLIDRSQTDNPYYWQNDLLSMPSDEFTFYYATTRKPLRINTINLWNKVPPYTYASRQVRTGEIDGVTIPDTFENSDMQINFDNLCDSLSSDDLAALFRQIRNQEYNDVDNDLFNYAYLLDYGENEEENANGNGTPT